MNFFDDPVNLIITSLKEINNPSLDFNQRRGLAYLIAGKLYLFKNL